MKLSKVQKWGKGQGLRLSKELLMQAGIAVGDEVEIVTREHQIIVRKLGWKRKYDINELVSRMPEGYEAREFDL